VLDEVAFVVAETLPVLHVCGQIDFLRCPKGGHLVLVHFPNVIVLDGQNDESVRVLLEKGLRQGSLSLCEVAVLGLKVVIICIGSIHL